MRDLLDILVAWPMPAIWLILAGAMLTFVRQRTGRLLVAAMAFLFILSAIPVVAYWLVGGLSGAAIGFDKRAKPPSGAASIVVPTAGSYDDAQGIWRSRDQTVRRVAPGYHMARRWRPPLVIAGVAPNGIEPPEAETVALTLGLREAIIVPTPKSTDETGPAVAIQLDASGIARRVVVVTDAVHIARVNAVLRHAGLDVVGAISASDRETGAGRDRALGVRDFIPSRSTLAVTTVALHEYVAVAVHLVRGSIGLEDL